MHAVSILQTVGYAYSKECRLLYIKRKLIIIISFFDIKDLISLLYRKTHSSGGLRRGCLECWSTPSVLICISLWPIVYVATLRSKSSVYSLFGDTDLAQQCQFHTAVFQTFDLYLMHHNVLCLYYIMFVFAHWLLLSIFVFAGC